MMFYWLMFLMPAWGLFTPGSLPERQRWIGYSTVAVFFIFLMGYRHNIGGDWPQYLSAFEYLQYQPFDAVTELDDVGYYGLNWLVARLGGSIYVVNSLCASALVAGVVTFSRRLPLPWMGMLVAVPYMLIVVGMGYTRQSVALGFALLGFVALADGRIRAFVIWVAIGALFHKTAVLLLPIAALAATKRRVWTLFWVGATSGLMFSGLMEGKVDTMWTNYVEAEMESQGALIRVLMNVVPAAVYLLYARRLTSVAAERRLWTLIAIISILCLPALSFTSTAVDRLALYLLPIQMYVFGRIHLLAPDKTQRTMLVVGVVGYYAVVQWTWLNLAVHATGWVPYKNLLWSV